MPWNEVQEEVIVRGNKRLTVDKRVFAFDGDIQIGVASLPVNITTENTNWQITGNLHGFHSAKPRVQREYQPRLLFRQTVRTLPRICVVLSFPYEQEILLTNWNYRLHVSQQPACGFGNSMKLMRIGGSNYQTTRMGNGGVCWMIDASREGGPNMAARPRSYSLAPAMVGPIYYGSIPQRACPMAGDSLRLGRLLI